MLPPVSPAAAKNEEDGGEEFSPTIYS